MIFSKQFNVLSVRSIWKSTTLLARIPRKRIVKKVVYDQKPSQWETRKLRPLSDMMKVLGFTVLTGVSSFTVAILIDGKMKNTPQGVGSWTNPESWTAVEKHIFVFFALNTAVFLAWRVGRLQPFLTRYFTNSYASKALYLPMILSAFSHRSLIHFGLNMYVAETFLSDMLSHVTSPSHFWAFFTTAAAFSSFVSLLEKAYRKSPVRSLGASGALMAMLCYLCIKFPDMQLEVVFAPGYPFKAEYAFYGIFAIDFICLLLGFKVFDHACHLGGQIFGWIYAKYGEKAIWGGYSRKVKNIAKSVGL